MVGLVVLSAWLPGYRLERELAVARAEGLWTEASDVRAAVGTAKPEENAASLVRALIAETKTRGLEAESLRTPLAAVLKGAATPAHTATIRFLCTKNADLAARWRVAAAGRAVSDYDEILSLMSGDPDDPDDKNVANAVRAFQKYEAERAAIRKDRR